MKHALVGFFVVLAVSGCNKEKAPGGTTASGAAASDDLPATMVVGRLNGEEITIAMLDKEAGGQLAQLEEAYRKQKFQLRKQHLDALITGRLVKAEAQKSGKTEEQFLQSEIDAKVAPPPDEEMKAVFDANAARLPPGTTFESVRGEIVKEFSEEARRTKAEELFARLRADAKVETLLREPLPPRKQVEAKGPSKGPENAPITIVEFSDFECPFCSRGVETVDQVMQKYPGKVRLVFRHFPLEFHASAKKAAEGSLCANEQGKFWEFHDVLFKNQRALGEADLKNHAQTVGLDAAKFAECLASGKHAETVKADMEAASKVGVNGTPAFFVNGVPLSGARPLSDFEAIIEQELAGR